jgi:hypothetical protein
MVRLRQARFGRIGRSLERSGCIPGRAKLASGERKKAGPPLCRRP